MEDLLADFDRILAPPACRAALERGEPFALEIPKLGFRRSQVNLLCAAAIVAERAGDHETSLRRLAAARAFPRILDDGSAIARAISHACAEIVAAAERVLAGGDAY